MCIISNDWPKWSDLMVDSKSTSLILQNFYCIRVQHDLESSDIYVINYVFGTPLSSDKNILFSNYRLRRFEWLPKIFVDNCSKWGCKVTSQRILLIIAPIGAVTEKNIGHKWHKWSIYFKVRNFFFRYIFCQSTVWDVSRDSLDSRQKFIDNCFK